MIRAGLIQNREEQKQANYIRHEVFVKGQQVPESLEYDEFEEVSRHFLAFYGSEPCGTARWRFTEKGIKLERFAVLDRFRGRGVGQALVRVVLDDVYQHQAYREQSIYLHAQTQAISLYQKFGFKTISNTFVEAGIEHKTMTL